ncbi:MAG: L-2-amino-thiazoline-4-carboxylic acid hydrolase [Anaerolineae bacterium]|nr:L-2-amino-thiazoline-4-carboxylic acid hydrolase [Anaerolineae bacterium]
MKVEELPHYGKDLLSIAHTGHTPLRKKLALLPPALRFLGGIITALGPAGSVRFIKTYRSSLQKAQGMDWSHLYIRGLSAPDLQQILPKMVLAKELADALGLEKAARLRNAMSDSISYRVLEEVFAPPQVFVECGQGDFLPAFKQYYRALMTAMQNRGLEFSEVVVDSPDAFQINVTYCAWAEVSKSLGNAAHCYYSTCYGDEVFFPRLARQVGFEYSRSGTLAQDKPFCDHCFKRIQVGQEMAQSRP